VAPPILPRAIDAALGRFRRAVAARFGPRLREVVLFGSWARGDAHEESDVDVLVVVDDLDERERREVMDLAYDAAAAAIDVADWVSVSPLPYSTAQAAELRARERRLFRDIAAEGVAL
jgi:predicted nucleotidyltransferase